MDAARAKTWGLWSITPGDWAPNSSRASVRALLAFCLFEVTFYFAYRYGMSFSQAFASPFWFPDSVLLCALLLSRPQHWWIFILGALPIRLFSSVASGIPFWFLLATFVIDSIKGLLAAVALRRFIKVPYRPQTVREFGFYCLYAVLLVPMLCAFGGAAARAGLGHEFWNAWEQWFMGNALTHLIVTPALFCLLVAFLSRTLFPRKRRWVEGGLLTIGLVVSGYVAFHTESVRIGLAESRFYAPIPFLFWAALRFGMGGAAGAITIITVLAVQAALSGQGLFIEMTADETALALQHFLILRAAPLYLVAILVEQTKHAEAETEKQRQEQAHLSRVSTMGQLASSLAHELNQPLGAILCNAEAADLLLQRNPPDYQEIRNILSDIRRDDQRAAAVIERLRLMLKRRPLEFEAVSVAQLFAQVMSLMRTEFMARHVTVRVTEPEELPPVRGDRVHLQQVLLNLLVNGADAVNDLPLEQRRIEMQARRVDQSTLELSVRDMGPGIPEEKLPEVFEPFYTTKPNGMGMGLAISKTLVESHGGHIWAENHPDRGAVFRFTLQIAPSGARK